MGAYDITFYLNLLQILSENILLIKLSDKQKKSFIISSIIILNLKITGIIEVSYS